MDIAPSARRHGVSDEDMRHAIRNPIRVFETDDIAVYIGASRSGIPLEVGVLTSADPPIIVHAMPARTKYLR